MFTAQALRARAVATIQLINALMLFAVAAIGLGGALSSALGAGAVAAALWLSLRLAGMAEMALGLAGGLFETAGLIRDAMRSACLPPEEAPAPTPVAISSPAPAACQEVLRLEGVRLRRPADGALLGPFDAVLSRGQTLGIAGPSGSGKSTLVGLLCGFGRPEAGRILLEGRDITRWPLSELRRRVAVAPQQGRLFRRSLRDNLRHGCPEATDAVLARAIALAGLGPVVAEHGLDADVGEDGALLSGGERQRILFARALLKVLHRGAPLLVLDEALSALDPAAEAAILDAVARLPQAPAVLAVSHSPALLQRMDRTPALRCGPRRAAGAARLRRAEGHLPPARSRAAVLPARGARLCADARRPARGPTPPRLPGRASAAPSARWGLGTVLADIPFPPFPRAARDGGGMVSIAFGTVQLRSLVGRRLSPIATPGGAGAAGRCRDVRGSRAAADLRSVRRHARSRAGSCLPLAPRLGSAATERCRSGRTGRSRKPKYGLSVPWVRIPPSPPGTPPPIPLRP